MHVLKNGTEKGAFEKRENRIVDQRKRKKRMKRLWQLLRKALR